MRIWAAAAAIAAVFVSAHAGARDWDSAGGWDVYEVDTTRCVVGRVFPDRGATFGIILALDGDVRVFATGTNWTVLAGQKIDAAVGLDDQFVVSGGSVGIEQGRNRGFVAAADEAFLARFVAAGHLNLRAAPGTPDARVPISGAALGLAQARRCLAALREDGRGQVSQPAPVGTLTVPRTLPATATLTPTGPAAALASGTPRPASPRGSRATWIAADDYPAAALRAAQEGSVTVRLAINTSGDVAGCDVTRSSGSPALDETTCRMIQRRARYKPATDGSGRAIEGADQHTVRWSLPTDR